MAFMVSFVVVDVIVLGFCGQYSIIKVCTPLSLTPLPQFTVTNAFDQDISSWDVGLVIYMDEMVSIIVGDLSSFFRATIESYLVALDST